MKRKKGQFMLLSAIILSIMVMSAGGIIAGVQDQRYESSSLGYYVNMIQHEADEIDLSNPRERQKFRTTLDYVNDYSTESDYWESRHCFNVTLVNSMNNVDLTCIGEPEIRTRIMAIGYDARNEDNDGDDEGGNAPIPPGKGASSYGGIYDRIEEEWILDAGRSYNIAVLDTDTGEWVKKENYDIYGDASEAGRLADYIESLPQTGKYKVYLVTADEPRNNRLSNDLESAMYSLGASKEVFGSEEFASRSAYVLVGRPGIGEGNAYREYYEGPTDNSVDSFVDVDVPVNH